MGTSWTNICKGKPLPPLPQAGEAVLGRSHFKRQHPRCFVFPCSLNLSSIPLSPPRRSHLSFQALLSFSNVHSVTVLRWKNGIPFCLATTHTHRALKSPSHGAVCVHSPPIPCAFWLAECFSLLTKGCH